MSNKTRRVALRQKSARRPLPWWPFALAGGSALFVALIAFAVWQAAGGAIGAKVPVEVQGAPSLKADKEKVDLGSVKLGQTVKVSFRISNVGDKTLNSSEAPYVEVAVGC